LSQQFAIIILCISLPCNHKLYNIFDDIEACIRIHWYVLLSR